MKKLTQNLFAATVAAVLAFGTLPVRSQETANPPAGGQQDGGGRRNRQGGGPGGPGGPGGGNFDPAQFRQRMMERYREQLEIKDDAEWKLISERIEKVSDARRAVGGGFRGGFGGGRGGGPGGPGGPGGGRGFGGEQSPEAEALQKAIEANAPADEIKGKLEKYRASVKDKEAKLEKAQDDLRSVLSVKQEAAAVLAGLLK